jgi:hypothetical protein
MNDWAADDRAFFKDTFEPFQQALIDTNQDLLPDIVANSGTALQQNLKDMMGSEFLKESFRSQITEAGGDISRFATDFAQQVDQIPSAEERVGQAMSGIEQRFGAAGKELKRAMAAKGVDVTQASARDLAIAKAGAKAGGTQQAQEAARREKLGATERGIGVLGAVQQSQSTMLQSQQSLTQSGADLLPQVGGVQETESLSQAGVVGADMATAMSEKILGQTSDTKSAEFVQKGLQVPRFFDKETGKMVDAAGNEIVAAKTGTKKFRGSTNVPAYAGRTESFDGGSDAPGGVGVAGTGAAGQGGSGGVGVGPGAVGGGTPGGGLCCFTAGTLVSTPNGPVAIETVEVGDVVSTFDLYTSEPSVGEVGGLKTVERSAFYVIEFESGKRLEVTDDHPLFTEDGWAAIHPKGYTELSNIVKLNIGSKIFNEDGNLDVVEEIIQVPGIVTVYTLKDVNPAHNYFADGILASNAC